MSLRDRLPMLLEMRREHLVMLLENARDPEKDREGHSTSSLQGTLRFIGVAEYVLMHSIQEFRSYLSQTAQLGLRLLERFERGEPIKPSYVSMLKYTDILNALAAHNWATADSISSRIGGRPELEAEFDHPVDRFFGYALRACVLNNTTAEMAEWVDRLEASCRDRDNIWFKGYPLAFRGIMAKDSAMTNEGLKMINDLHPKLTKRSGVFRDTEDELLCVWGIAIANLARRHGLQVECHSSLIPEDLIN